MAFDNSNSTLSYRDGQSSQPVLAAEHEKVLQALHSEIEYHRKHDENGSYVEKAVALVSNSDSSQSLYDLEFAYDKESRMPNTLSREEVTKAITYDQKAIDWQDTGARFAANASNIAMVILGGKWGGVAAAASFALDTMHPNDTLNQQAIEGALGLGLGMGAASLSAHGFSAPNRLWGTVVAGLSFPMARGLSHGEWPNQGYGLMPNPKDIFQAPVVFVRVPERAWKSNREWGSV